MFGSTREEAERAVQEYHGWGDDELPWDVKRAPEFDSYAALGHVPAEAMLAEGWWMSCPECGKRVDEEGTEDEETGEWTTPVCVGTDCYCSQACLDSLTFSQNENKRKKQATRDAFERRTGGVAEIRDCYSHSDGGTIDFRIPGGITTGRFKWSDAEPDGSFWVNPHDIKAFRSLVAAWRRDRVAERHELGVAG